MRDKLIGLAVVIVVVGLIWYVGKLRQTHVEPHGADGAVVAPSMVPYAIDDAALDVAPLLDASIADGQSDALEPSTACRSLGEASQRRYEQAQTAGYCVDFSLDELGCKTSSNGATWGLRVDDVTDLEADAAACPMSP
jgi:hypothetical protein